MFGTGPATQPNSQQIDLCAVVDSTSSGSIELTRQSVMFEQPDQGQGDSKSEITIISTPNESSIIEESSESIDSLFKSHTNCLSYPANVPKGSTFTPYFGNNLSTEANEKGYDLFTPKIDSPKDVVL